LILDSDAFPVKNWLDILLPKINQYHVACPIRHENLDNFPHPCIVFFDRLAQIDIKMKKHTNLCGKPVEDPTVITNQFFPLLKTNVFSPHPILCVIYYHLFYHHGAGSRGFLTRATHFDRYYDHIHESQIEYRLFDDVLYNTETFISSLLGEAKIPLL